MNDKPPSPRRRRIALALACAPGWAGLSAVAGCQAPARLHADARTRTPGSGFTAAAERLLMAGLDRSPEASISAGRYALASQVTLPDATNRAADLAFAEAGMAELVRFDIAQLTPAERIDHGLLKNRYEATRWQLLTLRDWAWNPARYNVAPPISLLLNTPYAPEAERLRTVSARLAQVPAYYAAARSSVEDPTAEHRELAQTQARGTLALLGPGLQARVAASALAPAEQAEFAARLAAARQAVQTWQDWLSQLQPTRTFRLGPELYEQKFRYDVQSPLSARELYERAAAEKERLHADMDARARELWPRHLASQTMPQDRLQRIGRMVAHLSQQHVPREDFVAEIKRQIPLLAEFVRRKNLLEQDETRPLVVRETPPYLRGSGAIASISAPGPFNPTADTYYNVTPLDDFSPEAAASLLREYNHWVLQILNIHEAIPGHYTQLLHANKAPSLAKALLRNGAMVEGWAVYAERMMLEQGWGEQAPEMWLMYGKWNLRVVANAMLDIAIHTRGMTEAQALDLMQREAFQESAEAANKWRRAKLSQVQLTTYFSGYADILDLRARRRQALGPAFDLKAFHDEFLGYGSAPVAAIASLMERA
jgi:uncharacterized protein (DUF885 family)